MVHAGKPVKAVPLQKDAKKDFQGKVVIIGAGAAGLMAGNSLKYMGVEDFVILESSDRIGGRLQHTEEFCPGIALDVGAEWIHFPDTHYLHELLIWDEDKAAAKQIETVDYKPKWKMAARFFYIDIMRVLYHEKKFKKTSWSQWLQNYVVSHVSDKVKVNSCVQEVDYSGDKSKVILTDGTVYEADKVICTAPLTMLKSKRIKFTPELPEAHQKALDAMEMPPGFKAFFKFKERFFPDVFKPCNLWTLLREGIEEYTWFDGLFGKGIKDTHIMGVLATGKYAEKFANLDDEAATKLVLADMDQHFDGQASKYFDTSLVRNWTQDPHIGGAYSYVAGKGARAAISKPVRGRLYFGGEYSSEDNFCSVPGACLEGRRAAVDAMDS